MESSVLRFSAEAMQVLMDHTWPGNVRELENAVERAVVLATEPVVPADVLPEHILHANGMRIRRDESGRLPADASLFEKVADYERRLIIESLEAASWSQTDAAEALRIPLVDAEPEDQAAGDSDQKAWPAGFLKYPRRGVPKKFSSN